MKRKTFLPQVAAVSGSVFLAKDFLNSFNHDFPVGRGPRTRRKCTGLAVEKAVPDFTCKVVNKELRWLFENCFLNHQTLIPCGYGTPGPGLRYVLFASVERSNI